MIKQQKRGPKTPKIVVNKNNKNRIKTEKTLVNKPR